MYTRLRAHPLPPRLVSSRLARPTPTRPLQVVAAKDKYDSIGLEGHAAKQPQARARAQPSSCALDPFRVPSCARLCTLKRQTSSASRYTRHITAESLYYTRFLHKEASTVEMFSRDMSYVSWRRARR